MKLLRLFQLVAYLLVASQLVFYLVVFSDALKASPIDNFLEHRRAVENLVGHRYRIVYCICLISSALTVIASAKNPGSAFFISSSIALLCLTVDVYIALRFSIPLNHLINTAVIDTNTGHWEQVRSQWLEYFRYRGIFSALGMMSLFAGLVFDKS